MPEYILETQNLSYQYPDGTLALKEISIKFEKGKKIALLGSNGAGKSTLFLTFNGILKPSNGRVLFNGNEVKYNHSSLIELRKNVGIVFQDPDTQLFSANVYQEVSFGAINLGLSEKAAKERIDKALDDTGILHLKNKPTHFLSYGQKKRVCIADILVMKPEVLICDEPTACLDPKHTIQTMNLLDSINKKGTTIILSTHDIDTAYSWADYVIVMSNGTLSAEGKPEEIFCNEQLLNKSDLVKPLILEIYTQLVKKNIITKASAIPKNKQELYTLINKANNS